VRKVFCDCCGKEIEGFSVYKFSYRCHLSKDRRESINCHVDAKSMQPISGRDDSVELCITCYNKVVIASVKKLEELSETYRDSL
jgi:hypothetical protein